MNKLDNTVHECLNLRRLFEQLNISKKVSLEESIGICSLFKQNMKHLISVNSVDKESLSNLELCLKHIFNAHVMLHQHGFFERPEQLLFHPDKYVNTGYLFDSSTVKFYQMKTQNGNCHENVYCLYISGVVSQMCTGFALQKCEDEMAWVHHSWGLDENEEIVETVYKDKMIWLLYFGFPVPSAIDTKCSDEFCVPSIGWCDV